MPISTQSRVLEFDVADPEPAICAVKAEFRGAEVFVTMRAKTSIVANSYPVKQAAYEMRHHREISMSGAGIEQVGAAFPIRMDGKPVTSDALIVKEGQTADQLLEEQGIRYNIIFRLKP